VTTVFSLKLNILQHKVKTLIKTIYILLCAAEHPHPTFLLAAYLKT